MKRRFTIRVILILTAVFACVLAAYVQNRKRYQREEELARELNRYVLESDCFEMHGGFVLGAMVSRTSILPSIFAKLADSSNVVAFDRVDSVWINNVADAGIFDFVSQFPYLKEVKVDRICSESFEEFCEAATTYRGLNPDIVYVVDFQPFDPDQAVPPLANVLVNNAMSHRTTR